MGIVIIHAIIRSSVTPQRTAERRLIEPTPMMLPEITCVVLTGTPKCCVMKSVIAPAVCEQKPSTGVIFVMRLPIVFIIFHPPDIVPIAIAVMQTMGIQLGAPVRLAFVPAFVIVSGRSHSLSPSKPYCEP